MTKTILILAIAAAFVAGTITTGSLAYAASSLTLEGLFAMLMQLETQIISMQTELQQLQLLPGPPGPPGIQGETGPAGVLNFYRISSEKVMKPGFDTRDTAFCDDGDTATGGGLSIPSGNLNYLMISAPTPDSSGWIGGVVNEEEEDNILTVYAICADTALPAHTP